MPTSMKQPVAIAGQHPPIRHPGAISLPLHLAETTAVAGCHTMVNDFFDDEYPEKWGTHDDHEGFYVVSGCGVYWLEGTEYDLAPGVAMLAPAGLRHGLKKAGKEVLKVFIFHFPAAKENNA